MRVVTRRTGLSADLLRAWERRHAVVKPSRSENGHRLYSDLDIERLRLLYRVTVGGRGIGQVAVLPTEALAALARQDESAESSAKPHLARKQERVQSAALAPSQSAVDCLDECLRTIERLDATALAAALRRAAISLHGAEFLDSLVVPLLERVGTGWHQGTLPPVHGHFARAVLRRTLDNAVADANSPSAKARVVVATPVGELHEFDALLAALSAAVEGWRVTYLGTNLPAEHIAKAAGLTKARAVAVSVEYRAIDPALGDEFRRLRRALPKRVALVVVGSASSSYSAALDKIGVIRPVDLADFRSHLRTLMTVRTRGRSQEA